MHIASTFPLTLRRVHSWLKKLSSNRSLSLFFTLSALTITPVFAQVPEPLLSPAEEPVAEDPYWRETVDKAIEQYQSENPDIRRSAVMLLGKYPVPPAQETVAKALEDSDASVRQAALVSVLEEQMQIPPATREKLFSLLQDRSVSIRRIASNSLPMILGGFPFTMQPGANQLTRQMPDHVLESLQKAFRDEDASVRRNMVTNYQYLRIQLPPETVTALLHDPDPQVAIHAIQWALPMIEPANLPEEVEKMMERDDPNFRLELIRALQSRFSPGMMSIFQKLQQDPNPRVALEARLTVFNHHPTVEGFQEIIDLWEAHGRDGTVGSRIVFSAQLLGEEGEPFLRKWLDADDPEIRQQAAQVYFSRFGPDADSELLLKLLRDPVHGVRQQATQALILKNRNLSENEILTAANSRYVDVRRSAADMTRFLEPEKAEEILLDLLLDTESVVQAAALQQIAQRKIDGWEEILIISLESGDPVTSRTALQILLRQTDPQTLDLLQTYLDKNPRSPWRPQIEAHLQKRRASP